MPDISSVVVAPEPHRLSLRERNRWLRLLPHLRRGNRLVRQIHRGRGDRDALLAALRVWQGQLLNRIGIEIETRGQPLNEPVLFVSNHVSWVDPLIFGSLLPARFLAKAEVRDWPILGNWVSANGTLFIKRLGHQTAMLNETLAGIMREGGQTAIFPEGTTSDGRGIGYFFPRLFGAAQAAGVPVQPVALRYVEPPERRPVMPFIDGDAFFPHARRLVGSPDKRAELHFLTPIDTAGRDRRSLANEARRQIAAALDLPASPRQEDDFERQALFARLRSLF